MLGSGFGRLYDGSCNGLFSAASQSWPYAIDGTQKVVNGARTKIARANSFYLYPNFPDDRWDQKKEEAMAQSSFKNSSRKTAWMYFIIFLLIIRNSIRFQAGAFLPWFLISVIITKHQRPGWLPLNDAL